MTHRHYAMTHRNFVMIHAFAHARLIAFYYIIALVVIYTNNAQPLVPIQRRYDKIEANTANILLEQHGFTLDIDS